MGSVISCHTSSPRNEETNGERGGGGTRTDSRPRTLQTLLDSIKDPLARQWLADLISDNTPLSTPLGNWLATTSTASLFDKLPDITDPSNIRALYHLYVQAGVFRDVYTPDATAWESFPKLPSKLITLLPVLTDPGTGLLAALSKLVSRVEGDVALSPRQCPLRKSKILNNSLLFMLSLVTPNLQITLLSAEPTLLFSLDLCGHSWIRFVDAIDLYPAPVLLALKSKALENHPSNIFGAYIPGGIQETATKYGGSADTFLWGFQPEFNVCLTSGLSSKYLMLNKQSQFAPTGLGFGGQPGTFRMYLAADLHNATICISDATYKAGAIVDMTDQEYGDDSFQKVLPIDEIEVWGLGVETDLQEQQYAKQRDEEIREDRRKVDRARLADNAFDREYLLGHGGKAGEREGEVQAIVEERRKARGASAEDGAAQLK